MESEVREVRFKRVLDGDFQCKMENVSFIGTPREAITVGQMQAYHDKQELKVRGRLGRALAVAGV